MATAMFYDSSSPIRDGVIVLSSKGGIVVASRNNSVIVVLSGADGSPSKPAILTLCKGSLQMKDCSIPIPPFDLVIIRADLPLQGKLNHTSFRTSCTLPPQSWVY